MNNKIFFFQTGAFFGDNGNFPNDKIYGGGGQLPLPHATTPVMEGYVVTLLPETPGTRVPVQIPDGYPGTKISESPSTSWLLNRHCVCA